MVSSMNTILLHFLEKFQFLSISFFDSFPFSVIFLRFLEKISSPPFLSWFCSWSIRSLFVFDSYFNLIWFFCIIFFVRSTFLSLWFLRDSVCIFPPPQFLCFVRARLFDFWLGFYFRFSLYSILFKFQFWFILFLDWNPSYDSVSYSIRVSFTFSWTSLFFSVPCMRLKSKLWLEALSYGLKICIGHIFFSSAWC